MITKTVQIQDLDASTLINKLDGLTNEVQRLQSQLTNQNDPTDYITRKQIADMFGISLVSVNDWTKKGILKAYKIANRVYFKRSEVESSLTEIKSGRANR